MNLQAKLIANYGAVRALSHKNDKPKKKILLEKQNHKQLKPWTVHYHFP